jgi:Arc/MetJ family transcription regulator
LAGLEFEWRTFMGRTSIELNDKLVDEAMKLTNKRTKPDLVNCALEELVRKLERKKNFELEGKADWSGRLE